MSKAQEAIAVINEGHVMPFLAPETDHSEIGAAPVDGFPGLRRLFYWRRGVIFNNNVIVGNN